MLTYLSNTLHAMHARSCRNKRRRENAIYDPSLKTAINLKNLFFKLNIGLAAGIVTAIWTLAIVDYLNWITQ